MSYMSYCQFENITWDITSCINAVDREEIDSDREKHYAKMLRDYCEQYIESYDNSIYNENNTEVDE